MSLGISFLKSPFFDIQQPSRHSPPSATDPCVGLYGWMPCVLCSVKNFLRLSVPAMVLSYILLPSISAPRKLENISDDISRLVCDNSSSCTLPRTFFVMIGNEASRTRCNTCWTSFLTGTAQGGFFQPTTMRLRVVTSSDTLGAYFHMSPYRRTHRQLLVMEKMISCSEIYSDHLMFWRRLLTAQPTLKIPLLLLTRNLIQKLIITQSLSSLQK